MLISYSVQSAACAQLNAVTSSDGSNYITYFMPAEVLRVGLWVQRSCVCVRIWLYCWSLLV